MMLTRRLGRTDLDVSVLCFGGNVFGWTTDAAQSAAVLDAFVEAGGNFVDTADVYSTWVPGNKGGESEVILGQWMKDRGNRKDMIVATKLGVSMGDGKQGLSKRYMVQAVEDSLTRLQTDYIDLYQSHRDDETTPLEETMAAFNDLVKQGKVRWIGASKFTAARLAEANAVAEQGGWSRYESIQPPYNLLRRSEYEGELESLCQKDAIGVITYYSLASGFLTGKYRPDSALPNSDRASGVQKLYMNEKGWAVLAAVDDVAERLGATPAQVALAWIVGRPGMTGPIASATTPAQLQEIVGGISLSLDADALAMLDKASA